MTPHFFVAQITFFVQNEIHVTYKQGTQTGDRRFIACDAHHRLNLDQDGRIQHREVMHRTKSAI